MRNIEINSPLPHGFFKVSPKDLARKLIGKQLVFYNNGARQSAIITETEAYLSNGDLASHSAPGLTARNAPMFEDGGTVYVYKIYGIHHCFNIVSETIGIGSAVLIRSAEPFEGIELMKLRRNTDNIEKLCKGPGNFCKAMGFGMEHNKLTCYGEEIKLYDFLRLNDDAISTSQRIGITKSSELLLRYYIEGSRFVSSKESC